MIGELDAIRRLLREEWDPIGVNESGPDDEYETYAFRIFGMLNEGKGEAEIATFLRSAAIENMGLGDAGDYAAIARRVIEIHESWP